MGITVHINYEAELSKLLKTYPCFSFLKNVHIPKDQNHTWKMDNTHWGYSKKITYAVQVMFIGKTGYGKSTTLNKIVGANVFETNDVTVCTKDLYCGIYRINSTDPSFIQFSDLPGVGESNYADNQYYTWYKEMLNMSDVIVYILRADQRDFAVDEMIFSNLFKESDKEKVILALNYADKVEPINRKGELSPEQLKSLERKIDDVSRIFKVNKDRILYYSATDKINFKKLISKISEILKKRLLYRPKVPN